MSDFKYQKPFPITKDTTEYRLLTKDFVSTIEVDGRKILKDLEKRCWEKVNLLLIAKS